MKTIDKCLQRGGWVFGLRVYNIKKGQIRCCHHNDLVFRDFDEQYEEVIEAQLASESWLKPIAIFGCHHTRQWYKKRTINQG